MTAPLVITGPTGWIGSALLARLAADRGPGWQAGVRLFGSSDRPVTAPDGSVLAMRDLRTIAPADLDGAQLIHLAWLTRDKVALLGERRFTDTNLAIDDAVLAALAGARPAAGFVASSGAAALAAEGRDREPYGLGKLRQEDRFLAWAARAGVPLLAGRIFNIAGPHINKLGSYAVADFLGQGRRAGRIHVNAAIPVFRSYLHVLDLAALMLGGAGEAAPVDLCGAQVLEMADIAAAAARALRLPPGAVTRGPIDLSRTSAYLGDHTQTRRLAMRLGVDLAPFERQVADTATWLAKA